MTVRVTVEATCPAAEVTGFTALAAWPVMPDVVLSAVPTADFAAPAAVVSVLVAALVVVLAALVTVLAADVTVLAADVTVLAALVTVLAALVTVLAADVTVPAVAEVTVPTALAVTAGPDETAELAGPATAEPRDPGLLAVAARAGAAISRLSTNTAPKPPITAPQVYSDTFRASWHQPFIIATLSDRMNTCPDLGPVFSGTA